MTTTNTENSEVQKEADSVMRMVSLRLQWAERDKAETAKKVAERADWSTIGAAARAQVEVDFWTPTQEYLAAEFAKGMPEFTAALRNMVDQVAAELLDNRHRPSSTNPFSNGIEMETADLCARAYRDLSGALRYLEKNV